MLRGTSGRKRVKNNLRVLSDLHKFVKALQSGVQKFWIKGTLMQI